MEQYLTALETLGQKRHYKKGNILFFEGEIPNNFFFLLEGKIRVYKSLDLGIEKTLHIFYPTNFIAEMPSFYGSPYPASAICEEDSIILLLDCNMFKKKINTPSFYFAFIHSLLNKIKVLEHYITTNNQPLKQRLINFLLQNQSSLATLSQREIARLLNTTPESLSRILKILKNDGLIKVEKGKITIINIIHDY